MNAFGDAAEHVLVVANGRDLTARDAIRPEIRADFPAKVPRLRGVPSLRRLGDLARYMSRFDLALTYNRGALDAVMAKQLFGGCPLIHHEDGFNADEAAKLKSSRNLYRRLSLHAADRIVVPSCTLEEIAVSRWGQPREKVVRIPNGVELRDCAGQDAMLPFSSLRRRPDSCIICSVAGLRPVKNLRRLVRAFAATGIVEAELVIVGEGPERAAILAEARRLGVADRVHLLGFVAQPVRILRHADIFALSSDSEQHPIALIEAMAAGLPVVSTDVGDVAAMLAAENRRFVVARENEAAFTAALAELICRRDVRGRLGAANLAKSATEHGADQMVAAYSRLYAEVAGRPGSLPSPLPSAFTQAATASSIPIGEIPSAEKNSNISAHQRQKRSSIAGVRT